jgi:hypothetical protein
MMTSAAWLGALRAMSEIMAPYSRGIMPGPKAIALPEAGVFGQSFLVESSLHLCIKERNRIGFVHDSTI